jgi:hypothetical protein
VAAQARRPDRGGKKDGGARGGWRCGGGRWWRGGGTVGDGRGMVHSFKRWPDRPQPRQQRGSRQLSTLWCRRGTKQRKQFPLRERIGEALSGEGGGGFAGDRATSRCERWVGAMGAAVMGGGVAGASRPAPSIPADTAGGSEAPVAASTELTPGGRTFELTGDKSRPGAFEAAGTFHLMAAPLVGGGRSSRIFSRTGNETLTGTSFPASMATGRSKCKPNSNPGSSLEPQTTT